MNICRLEKGDKDIYGNIITWDTHGTSNEDNENDS